MGKIINYIAKGQGLGVKYLLLFALIVTTVFCINLKVAGDDIFIPAAQKVADEFLPIKIENGEVVEPLNVVKKHSLNLGNDQEPQYVNIILDTTTYTLEPTKLNPGLYMTRSAIYAVSDNETKVYNLEDSAYLPTGDYTDMFSTFLNWGIFAIAVFSFFAIALFYFIATIFYTTCSYIISAIMRKKYSYDLRMRLSSLAFITTSVVFFILGIFGYSSGLIFFLAVLALQSLVMKDIPSQE